MRHLILIVLALSLSLTARADEGRPEATVSTSGTSARTGQLGSGYKLVRCTAATHYRTGNASVTATTSDMVIPAITAVTIYVTGGEPYLAFILPSSTERSCSVFPRQTGPNGQIPPYAAATPVNGADISPSSVTTTTLTVSGFTSGGDAGFHNLVLSGNETVAGYTGGGDAGYNNVTVTGNLVFPGTGNPSFAYGGANTIQTNTNIALSVMSTLTAGTSADVKGDLKNTGTGANCSSNTGAVCVNDAAGLAVANGSGTTTATISAGGLISGDMPVTSGTFPAIFLGTGAAVAEGTDGLGGFLVSEPGRSVKVGRVCCSCRVAGSGGSDGIFIALMEDGSEIASVEVNKADNNACDDTARTLWCGNLATGLASESEYTGQFKNTTDCASNPTDCVCNFEILR